MSSTRRSGRRILAAAMTSALTMFLGLFVGVQPASAIGCMIAIDAKAAIDSWFATYATTTPLVFIDGGTTARVTGAPNRLDKTSSPAASLSLNLCPGTTVQWNTDVTETNPGETAPLIHIYGGGALEVDAAAIDSNDRPAIHITDGNLFLGDATITSTTTGWVVVANGSARVFVEGVQLSGPQSRGGLRLADTATLAVESGSITSPTYGVEADGLLVGVDGGTITGGETGIFGNSVARVEINGGNVVGRIGLYSNKDITVTNGSIVGDDGVQCGGICVVSGGSITGTLVGIAIWDAQLTVSGGTITGTKELGIDAGGDAPGSVVQISGGSVTGATGVAIKQNSSLSVTGGTVTGTREDGAGIIAQDNAAVAVSGGTIKSTGERGAGIIAEHSADVAVSGGTITGPAGAVTSTSTTPGTYPVTVVGGTASAPSATAGTTVALMANPPGVGQEFAGWTSVPNLSIPAAAVTTFVMPNAPVTITATYKTVSTGVIPAISVGTVSISGTARVGAKLTAKPVGFSPKPSNGYTYQWLRGATVIGTGQTYTPVAKDAGKQLTVTVIAKPINGYNASGPAQATAKIGNGVFTGKVTIKGTPKVGKTLTVDVSQVKPAPGKSSTYQWFVGGKAVGKATTAKTYKVTAKDAGQKITVKLIAKADGYTTQTFPVSKAVVVPKK